MIMKKRNARKFFSCMLAIVMGIGLVPTSVFAADVSNLITVNKTATALDENLETKIDLSFLGKEENLASDIVFVLDKSGASAATETNLEAMNFLENLSKQAKEKDLNVKVGVVLFNYVGNVQAPLTDIATGYDAIKTAMTAPLHMGTNMHAGLLAGKKMLDDDTGVLNSRKSLVLISDGATYLYSKDGDYTKAYTRSFGDPKEQINPTTNKPYSNGRDMQGGIWEYQSREYNVNENLTFSNAMKDPKTLDVYLDAKRKNDSNYTQYEYEYNYSSAYLNIGRKVMPIEADAVANIDAAYIHTDDTFQEIANKYQTYVFFKNTSDFDGSVFLKYLTRNTGGLSQDFVSLTKEVRNPIDKGSSVDDAIGKDFDFINDPSKITVTVGDEELKAEKIQDNEYGFGKNDDGTFRYQLSYNKDENKLHLAISDAVKATTPFKLTYYEKLVNVPTNAGTYTFDTNGTATLNLVDSNGTSVGSVDFPKPTVSYTVKPSEQNISVAGDMGGDLFVNGNTQHDKVYEAGKAAAMDITDCLDATPIKETMKNLEDTYGADNNPLNISFSDLNVSFTATLELPDELDFTDNATVELLNANDKFVISDRKIDGKKLTVIMSLKDKANNFKEIKEVVDGIGDQLEMLVKGVKFNDKAKADSNYTVKGTVSGNFNAKATSGISGQIINFDYTWTGKQMKGGEDFTALNSDSITLTVKYTEPTPEPEKIYTVTYDPNGGNWNGNKDKVSLTEVKSGALIKLNEAPTRDGYKFLYWDKAEYKPGTEYTVTGDQTFTAQWEKVNSESTSSTSSTNSNTGDNTNNIAWMTIMMGSLGLIAGLLLYRKRYRIK